MQDGPETTEFLQVMIPKQTPNKAKTDLNKQAYSWVKKKTHVSKSGTILDKTWEGPENQPRGLQLAGNFAG